MQPTYKIKVRKDCPSKCLEVLFGFILYNQLIKVFFYLTLS